MKTTIVRIKPRFQNDPHPEYYKNQDLLNHIMAIRNEILALSKPEYPFVPTFYLTQDMFHRMCASGACPYLYTAMGKPKHSGIKASFRWIDWDTYNLSTLKPPYDHSERSIDLEMCNGNSYIEWEDYTWVIMWEPEPSNFEI